MNKNNNFFLLYPEFSNERLIENWHRRTKVSQRAHYRTAVSYENKHSFITVLLLTVNVLIIGFISFVDIENSWKSVINTLVIMSSFLSGMETFFAIR